MYHLHCLRNISYVPSFARHMVDFRRRPSVPGEIGRVTYA